MSLVTQVEEAIEEMAPQMSVYADDFELESAKDNEIAAHRFITKGKVALEQIDLTLYKLGDDYGAISKETSRLIYYVRTKKAYSKVLGKYTTQIAVWRDVNSLISAGLASWVFRTVVLKDTGVIVSDGVQTDQGRRFWTYQIKYALDKELFVYALDFYSKTLSRITRESEFSEFASKYYGDDPKYRGYRFVISSHELNLE